MPSTTDESAPVAATINRRALNTEGQRVAFRALRAALTPALLKELHEYAYHPALIQIYALLRRLRPGDVETAMLAHRALVREIVRSVRWHGYLESALWPDLALLVHDFLDAHGFDHEGDGRWSRREVRT